MGRGQSDCWPHVTKVEDGKKWICKYCNKKFSGGASRIEAHLGLEGKTGNIRRCSNYPANQGVYNNLASTSSNNPPQAVINTIYSTHDQGGLEVIDTQNNLEITNFSEGVNGSGPNRSVCESEILSKQLVLDLQCEENDIEKQLQCLESRGKKRKPEVDVWLKGITVAGINLNDSHCINELIQKRKRHKDKKPLTFSTEYVGEELDENIKKVLKLVDDDKVFVIGIYGMGGVGKTLLATLVENEVKRLATFKDVLWVTVTNKFSISKLQDDIAKRIGVKLDEDDERIRSNNLSLALETKEKSIIILDDVWNYIDLQKVGIPLKVNAIKVILTTRLKHVCHQMDCLPNHMIQMIPLSLNTHFRGDENWRLFEVKLGHNGTPMTLSPEIEKIAKDIVSRCGGLPLGISVIARTMKGIDDIHQWKHALNKLKNLKWDKRWKKKS
ncbi:Ulp1 peptidase [Trifolium repens]|nr:Ulp1 peptidase [Trifolium repens]